FRRGPSTTAPATFRREGLCVDEWRILFNDMRAPVNAPISQTRSADRRRSRGRLLWMHLRLQSESHPAEFEGPSAFGDCHLLLCSRRLHARGPRYDSGLSRAPYDRGPVGRERQRHGSGALAGSETLSSFILSTFCTSGAPNAEGSRMSRLILQDVMSAED